VHSPWDHWSPRDYLSDYYRFVEPDEIATIRFVAEAARRMTEPSPVLVFGCGPTLHHVFAIAPYASAIHLADYLPTNLEEISAWLERRPPFHDWSAFVRYTLQCEGVVDPSSEDVAFREEMVRVKVRRLVQADAGDIDPLQRDGRAFYPAVVSCYCADSATDDKAEWYRYMSNIASMVSNEGVFITAALRKAKFYRVGERRFPSADVDESDLRSFLDQAFGREIVVEAHALPSHEAWGYTGIVLGHAVKRPSS
jgi:hypothetical protein